MIKKIVKIVCWPVTKFISWLASALPEGKKHIEEKIIDHCGTHSKYKKSCPACKQVVGIM